MRGLICGLISVGVFAYAYFQLDYMEWKTPTERKWAAGIAAVSAAALTGFFGTIFGFFN